MAALTKDQVQSIVTEYRDNHIPMLELATRYGKTRMGIYKLLKAAGVETSKAIVSQVATACGHCGQPIVKPRCQYRRSNTHFCCKGHFYLWLNRPVAPFIKYRHGLQLARKVIREHFFVAPGMVVHHIDRDEGNNSISNLMVFRCAADHVKFHRGIAAVPVFDGRTIDLVTPPRVRRTRPRKEQPDTLSSRVAAALRSSRLPGCESKQLPAGGPGYEFLKTPPLGNVVL